MSVWNINNINTIYVKIIENFVLISVSIINNRFSCCNTRILSGQLMLKHKIKKSKMINVNVLLYFIENIKTMVMLNYRTYRWKSTLIKTYIFIHVVLKCHLWIVCSYKWYMKATDIYKLQNYHYHSHLHCYNYNCIVTKQFSNSV